MKKVLDGIFKIVLILVVSFGYLIPPLKVKAASDLDRTLADVKAELKTMQNKLAANQNSQKKTQAEIDRAEANMGQTKHEIEEAEKEIVLLKDEMNKTNEEIEKLKAENEQLLILYQKLENENVYFSYITGASTITEMIMRMDAINQITDYNEQQLDEMEMLIRNNDKLSKELEKYQVNLDKKIVEYEKMIDDLGDDLSSLIEGVPDLEEQIATLKTSIKTYENMGCKDNDKLSVCVNVKNNTGWLRPVTKGKITSAFGMRFHPTKKVYQMHNGIDIGVSEGTKVYATANGVVGAVVTSGSGLSCGGQKIYLNVTVNGKAYTVIYMHLLQVNVKVGQEVTTDTVIALSGGGKSTMSYDKCTTGAHLHYGVAENVHYNGTASSASKMNKSYINPPGFPSNAAKGAVFYTR